MPAGKNVSHKPLAMIELVLGSYPRIDALGILKAGFYQRPAAPNPMTVTPIDELVSSATETPFRRILTGREPRDKPWHIEHSDYVGSETSVFVVTPSVDRQTDAAYLGMMRCGASRMARQPKAQKAYAPWASASGLADMPPSNVWPTWVRSVAAGGERGCTWAYICVHRLPGRYIGQ